MRTLQVDARPERGCRKTSASSQGMASDAVSNFGFGWRSAFERCDKALQAMGLQPPEVHLFAPVAIFPAVDGTHQSLSCSRSRYPITVVCSGLTLYITRTSPGCA